jgi:hypothetical protein
MPNVSAIDLLGDAQYRPLWRPSNGAGAGVPAGLPAGGRASPAGYWLVVEESGQDQGRLNVAVRLDAQAHADGRPLPRVAVELDRMAPNRRATRLEVEVRPDSARLDVDAWAWPLLSDGALLAVTQCWRFSQIDRQLDELEAWLAAEDPARPGVLRRLSPRRRAVLRDRDRGLRRLVLDLPHFEGPLTDPGAYLASPQARRAYRVLARRLGLSAWRDRIDERVEVIEASVASAIERQSAFDQAALELTIVLAILADLGFHIWVTMFWE